MSEFFLSKVNSLLSLMLPWKEVAIGFGIILLILIGYLIWEKNRKKKNGKIEWAEHVVTEKENIDNLARKSNLTWEELAKKNKIEAPYILNPGQIILVPQKTEIKQGNNSTFDMAENFKTAFTQFARNEKTDQAENSTKMENLKKEMEKIEKEADKNISSVEISSPSIVSPDKKIIVDVDSSQKIIEDIFQKKSELATPQIEEDPSPKNKIIVISIITLILVGLITGGIWKYKKIQESRKIEEKSSLLSVLEESAQGNSESAVQEENNTEDQKTSLESAPTEEEKLPADINVIILNGGDLPGSAGKVKVILEGAGYKKTEAKNATTSDYLGITVYYSSGFSKIAKNLSDVLRSKYPKIETKEASADEEKIAEIVIILGK